MAGTAPREAHAPQTPGRPPHAPRRRRVIPPEVATAVAWAGGAYVAVMVALSVWAQSRVHSRDDYLVAGRSLGLPLASATLFATWFGAGTVITATDAVRAEGMTAAALDPLGPGLCLVLAGLFLAGPLWRMQVCTLGDVFRERLGPRAEKVGSAVMVPGFLGWIAAQLLALSELLSLYLDVPPKVGLLATAALGAGYTLLGGMWAVTLTDAVQLALLLVGLAVLGVTAGSALGDGSLVAGLARLRAEAPDKLQPLPALAEAGPWLGLLAAGSLGNLPGQDLLQRVFASRSAAVARTACLLSGGAYLVIGVVPLLIGLMGDLLFPGQADVPILPLLAGHLLTPTLAVVLVVALLSAILSTLDSAILAPASIIAENLWPRQPDAPLGRLLAPLDRGGVGRERAAVALVTVLSVATALSGDSAWGLLETAYELGLVALLVPLVGAVHDPRRTEAAGLASMAVGGGVWAVHLALDAETLLPGLAGPWAPPLGLGCFALSALTWEVAVRAARPRASQV